MFYSKVITIAVLLVYVGFTTAVPSPVAENSPAADTAKDSDAQPTKRDDRNGYDEPHYIQCDNGEGLYRMRSDHSNSREDRWFDFSCRHVTSSSASCDWTSYINDWDDPMSFMCPANEYMGGIRSYHDNHREDRRFKVQCCRDYGRKTHECSMTGYVNYWDDDVDYRAPSDHVFVGITSIHDNHREDRRYKFITCKLY